MGLLDDLKRKVNIMIDEMESDSDYSRTPEFLEKFWDLRNLLQDEKDISFGKEKKKISKLLDLINKKGKENDMES